MKEFSLLFFLQVFYMLTFALHCVLESTEMSINVINNFLTENYQYMHSTVFYNIAKTASYETVKDLSVLSPVLHNRAWWTPGNPFETISKQPPAGWRTKEKNIMFFYSPPGMFKITCALINTSNNKVRFFVFLDFISVFIFGHEKHFQV